MDKREKKANFSDRENVQLLEGVQKHYAILTQTSKVANVSARKRNAWLDIARSVNVVGGHGRAPAAVQKRWKDMRDAKKNRPKAASRTGAGPPVPPAPYEELILQILGESTPVDGIMDEAAGDTFSMQETKSKNDLTGSMNYINLDAGQGDIISAVDHGDSLDLEGLTDTVITERETLASTPLKGDHCQISGPAHVGNNGHAADEGSADEGSAVPQASKRSSSAICRGILKKRKCPNKNGEDCDSEDEVTLTKKFLKAQIAMTTLQMDVLRAEKAHHDLEIEKLKIENEDRKERRTLERRELELRVKKMEIELHQYNGSV